MKNDDFRMTTNPNIQFIKYPIISFEQVFNDLILFFLYYFIIFIIFGYHRTTPNGSLTVTEQFSWVL